MSCGVSGRVEKLGPPAHPLGQVPSRLGVCVAIALFTFLFVQAVELFRLPTAAELAIEEQRRQARQQ